MKRRTFIEKASLSSVALMSSIHLSGLAQDRKIKIGLIGCGWYGMVITKSALNSGNVEVVAICDVDSDHLSASAVELEKLQGKRPKTFKDFNDLLDEKSLEAVFIGTPPHWHALQFIAACKKGLDIYCEKPLAYDIEEGRAMVKVAQEAGNIVQIGFQRRQSEAFKKAKSLIDEGKIGKVIQVGANIHFAAAAGDTTIQDPPASLDWDAWCGPAPKLPYRPSIGHMAWRLEKEYGNGHLVDWGIHNIDIARVILGLDMPTTFNSHGEIAVLKDKITTPDTLTSMMKFEQCELNWQHRMWGTGALNDAYNNGVFFYGDKGTLFASDGKLVLLPTGRNKTAEEMDMPTKDMQDKHVANFIDAVKTKNKNMLTCTIEDAFKTTASVQLAMISHYTKSAVTWDPQKNTIVNNDSATALLARTYRKPYTRPTV